MNAPPMPTTSDEDTVSPEVLIACDWFQVAKAGCGDMIVVAVEVVVVGEVPPAPVALATRTSMGGVILTGERIAFGRGRSLEFLTVETSCTGPPPALVPPPPPPPVSILSSSESLERSLPDSAESLSLDVPLDELDEEVDRELFFCWTLPLLATSGMSGGTPTMAVVVVVRGGGGAVCEERVVTCTVPIVEITREEAEGGGGAV